MYLYRGVDFFYDLRYKEEGVYVDMERLREENCDDREDQWELHGDREYRHERS